MSKNASSFLVLTICALVVAGCAPQEVTNRPPLIPIEDFFRHPTATDFSISTDGEHFSFIASAIDRKTLCVGRSEGELRCLEAPSGGSISSSVWVDGETLVYRLRHSEGSDLYRLSTDPAVEPKSLTAEINGSVAVLNRLHDVPGALAVSVREGDSNSVFRLNAITGEIEAAAEDPGDAERWVFDRAGRCRAVLVTDGSSSRLLVRDDEGHPWREALSFDNVVDLFQPLFFTTDSRQIVAYSNLERDRVAVVRVDAATGREVAVVAEDPDYDLFGDDESDFVHPSPKGKGIAYVFYTTWRREYRFFDDNLRRVHEKVASRFPDHIVRLESSDDAGRRHIVRVSSDRLHGVVYVYDAFTEEMRFIEDTYPWLDPKRLAQRQPLTWSSRDGLTIHGYLMLPAVLEASDLPLVVVAHGGPMWRDCWEMGRFFEHQLFADRGYAVLTVNFRGSSGYGKSFTRAGFKQNGLAVQDDISTGVLHLIEQGIVDPGRVAILGGSYGGYAALAGLTFTPEIYACGIDLFGPSSFFTFLDSLPPFFNLDYMYRTVGHPVEDRELLERTSPLLHVDRITAPLLIAQGGRDVTVNRAESDQMVAALQDRGIEVVYILEEDEGHGFFRDEERWLSLWRNIDAFLDRHIGTRQD
jgi:dipeptidyl aminopeptidase/acylaminoacyl peptidase